jgi:hypothetical protein
MSNQTSVLKPLLARYEVEIPGNASTGHVRYDEASMMLMAGDEPAAGNFTVRLPGGTSHTRVGQETTDDA